MVLDGDDLHNLLIQNKLNLSSNIIKLSIK